MVVVVVLIVLVIVVVVVRTQYRSVLGVPHNEDYSSLGSILGPPFVNFQVLTLITDECFRNWVPLANIDPNTYCMDPLKGTSNLP